MSGSLHEFRDCPYCLGKGGHVRLVYSRFLGTEPVVHDGPWETCWACNGTGKQTKCDSLFPGGHGEERSCILPVGHTGAHNYA